MEYFYYKSLAAYDQISNIKFNKDLGNFTNSFECWLQYYCGWRQRTFSDFISYQDELTEVSMLPFVGDHSPVWIKFCAGPQFIFIHCPSALLCIIEELMIADCISWASPQGTFGCAGTWRSS